MLLLRSGMHHVDVKEATLLLLATIIRGSSPATAARTAALLAAGAYSKIISIAADTRDGPDPQIAGLRFFSEYLNEGGETAARKFCGYAEGDAGSVTGMDICIRSLQAEGGNVRLQYWAGECLKKAAICTDMRPLMLDAGILKPLATYMKLICSDGSSVLQQSLLDYHTLLFESVACLLKLITTHSEEAKLLLVSEGVIPSIVWLLRQEGRNSQKLEAIYAFANVVITPSREAEEAIPLLLQVAAESTDAFEEAALRALRNALARTGEGVRRRFVTEGGVAILGKQLGRTDLQIVQHSIAGLRNVALLDVPLEARHQVAKFCPDFLHLLSHKDKTAPAWKIHLSITHHALCTICNLAVTDTIAQDISITGRSTLFSHIYRIIFDRDIPDTPFRLDALACLRNLCIDEDSCLLIASMGVPKLFELLFTGSPFLRAEAMAVLRNLILQNRYCFDEFFQVDGFIDELVADLSSQYTSTLQRCAVDIIHCYLTKGDTAHKRTFYDADCLPALLLPMEADNENKDVAVVCFRILQDYERRAVLESRDHWTRIWVDWKAEDAERKNAKKEKKAKDREERDRRRMSRKRAKKDSRQDKPFFVKNTQNKEDANLSVSTLGKNKHPTAASYRRPNSAPHGILKYRAALSSDEKYSPATSTVEVKKRVVTFR
ncbi:uncharacterized protein SPPG_05584 [Spizellomyces punctatus DAOM BR117]|uniref:Armadillo repeat-containing protein 8 n=1 Tax=Spizellomyces punctatus (strain DAOM BR117) TaxID=645134 RepID=A0A0L0HE88_SPIPD|nr:uncharacterized protein SPPG_05584 [Spizellomyces punctatus DAOM BR117]KNC99336.1 hypothetical protein SPPG_05584 [Spizellomyces punctatus DAOM BR117]|eukprot:XP_016607376.1 hypothetical protein SPPG_05584 [Spizellomyces punctatus DAOM BR117]